jgi:RimJ/RimL family protein N-acetyltransferase
MSKTNLTIEPLAEPHAREIVKWHYKAPYDVYDMGGDDVDQVIDDLLNPEYAYHALLAPGGELVAFCCFGKDGQVPGGNYATPALDLGLGVRPDLTGRGEGHVYVKAVLEHARRTSAPRMCRVTIAEFNLRAQRVWARAGFRLVERFESTHSSRPFLVFTYGM